MTHCHQGDVKVQDEVRGRAEEAMNESDKDGITAKIRKIGALPNKCKVDELGEPGDGEKYTGRDMREQW